MTTRFRNALEGLLIVLGILSLWPFILGYRETWYFAVAVLMVLLLAGLAVVRLRRVKRAFEEQDEALHGPGHGGPGHGGPERN